MEQEELNELIRIELQIQDKINQVGKKGITPKQIQKLNRAIHSQLRQLELQLTQINNQSSHFQHKNEIESLKTNLRRANIRAKLNQKEEAEEQKRELLKGGLRRRQKPIQSLEDAVDVSNTVTSDLKRIRGMMIGTVESGNSILEELGEQSAELTSISGETDGYGSDLSVGRGFISGIRRRAKTDTLLLAGAVAFFVLVCLYIVKKRIFGGWWFW